MAESTHLALIDDEPDYPWPSDLYLEGGDHRSLIHISHAQFHDLMKDVPHGHIGKRA